MYRNAAPGVGYVGSTACKQCHADIYAEFMQTEMGRSAEPASEPDQLARVPAPVTVSDDKLNRNFRVYRQGTKIFQSEYEGGTDGKEVLVRAEPLAYAVGAAGEVGITYVVVRGNRLFQAPLSFLYALPILAPVAGL